MPGLIGKASDLKARTVL